MASKSDGEWPPLILFARRLKGYLQGILNHCLWPLHTGILEGVNNKIEVLKEWPTASGITNTYFSRSEPLSPEFPDEPKKATKLVAFLGGVDCLYTYF